MDNKNKRSRSHRPVAERRVRRAPDEARAAILDGAERLFARVMPDEVGLRDVAAEAGVSHALVTHYFGTYDGLIEAAIARRLELARARTLERLATTTFAPDDLPLIDALIALADDPLALRLFTWSLLSGRTPDFLEARAKGLKLIVDAMAARMSSLKLGPPPRERLEFAVTSAIAMVVGFAVAGPAIHASLGRTPDRAEVAGEIRTMIRRYVDRRT